MIPSRRKQFLVLFPDAPTFRWNQVEEALFSSASGWEEVTTIPKAMRESLKAVPWMSLESVRVHMSSNGDTHKALVQVADGKEIESVLMHNPRGSCTICVSSQVGCAIRCGFCATGRMGLTRSLSSDEIVDQFRFWKRYLHEYLENPMKKDEMQRAGGEQWSSRTETYGEVIASRSPSRSLFPSGSRISNIVLMGMGEPLANYKEVRDALNRLLAHTDLGRTHITVSTVGVLPRLEQILTEKQWPHVRLAVSLHSAIASTRKQIVPTSYDDFLPKLTDWAGRYLKLHGNRNHHLTFEYVMLKGINDSPAHAKALAVFVNRIGRVKVNLIPYNLTGCEFQRSTDATILAFLASLKKNGTAATTRRTMGEDIAAACGQLAGSTLKAVSA